MEKIKSCLSENLKDALLSIANAIRSLTLDAVEKAGSGHAGTPLGCAEIGAYLYGEFLRHMPNHPDWINRDRFILSAGHASLLQYCCLHFSGYNIHIDDLKKFRRLHSKTPSHPQYGLTEGIETTTGVDGQGIGHAVGQALGLKILEKKFNRKNYLLFDAKIVCLAGDGCFMEGISHEVSSFAGHLHLNNLILIYDHNKTCLDGLVSESCSENTKKRYKAYGWDVYEIDGHNLDEIHQTFSALRNKQKKPVLIIAHTLIGKGTHKEGSYLAHNNPFGKEECKKAKTRLGSTFSEFSVPDWIYTFFKDKRDKESERQSKWNQLFENWARAHPHLLQEYQKMISKIDFLLEKQLSPLFIPTPISGRKASNIVINHLGSFLPYLYGGSADLARSDMTYMDQFSTISHKKFAGRNIKYGVREFGMGTIAIGLAQTKMITPFVGTFLAFSDYMLSSIRMAAMMNLSIIYHFTHDSIFIGQDGPTHQPIEHLAILRAIPNVFVIRPADANEVKMAWVAALKRKGPTAIVLSKQDLPLCEGTNLPYNEGLGKGAYVIRNAKQPVDFTLIATGSELCLALSVASILQSKKYNVKVVSMPCWELFEEQTESYKNAIISSEGERISIEAGIVGGWHKYVRNGRTISIDTFGKSGLPEEIRVEFGFTEEIIVKEILKNKL